MSEWSNGYVADIGYTYGYYAELNPLRIKMAFLNAGLAYPEAGTACELGFGQGMSVNMHASASLAEWHGTDFNPSQAAGAQHMAAAAGTGAQLYDQAFAEFCARDDLPDFDFIGLHGIWSWVSDENRAVIVDFVRRKLKVGGVLYISYNTMPGWAAMLPLRELLTEHNAVMAAPGKQIVPRIDDALAFAERVLETATDYSKANPVPKLRLADMKSTNRNYLAHEYFNRDWEPMSFSAMAKWLEPAKLSFACSAVFQDHLDNVLLNPERNKLLAEIEDVNFRQTVRDFLVNQYFRADYWVRGARKLRPLEQREQLSSQRVLMTADAAAFSMKQKTSRGDIELQEAIYRPVLDFLADHKIHSVGQIFEYCGTRNIGMPHASQAVFVLLSLKVLHLVQPDAVIEQVRQRTSNLNRHLCYMARDSLDMHYLASPVTGGGLIVDRFDQLFLLAKSDGMANPAQAAAYVDSILSRQGQKLQVEGKTVETQAEQLQLLEKKAASFQQLKLPELEALGIVF